MKLSGPSGPGVRLEPERPLTASDLAAAVLDVRARLGTVPTTLVLSSALRAASGPAQIVFGGEARTVLGIPFRVDANLPRDVIGVETRCTTCHGGYAAPICPQCRGRRVVLTLHRLPPVELKLVRGDAP